MVSFYQCSTKPSKTQISIDDSQHKLFKSIYEDLKQHYIDYSNKLLSIIENQLLDKVEMTEASSNKNNKTKNK